MGYCGQAEAGGHRHDSLPYLLFAEKKHGVSTFGNEKLIKKSLMSTLKK